MRVASQEASTRLSLTLCVARATWQQAPAAEREAESLSEREREEEVSEEGVREERERRGRMGGEEEEGKVSAGK